MKLWGGGIKINNKYLNSFLFFVTIIFLGVSFYSATLGSDNFTIQNLLNTDGLTLLGIIITFIYTIMSKVDIIRYKINSILINNKVFDYKITILLDYKDNLELDYIKKIFDELLSKNLELTKLNIDVNSTYHSNKKYYYRDIFSNLNYILDKDEEEIYIELNGGIKYNALSEIVKFLVLDFLDNKDINKKLQFKRCELKLDSKKSEMKMTNLMLNEHIKKYKLNKSYIDIELDESTDLFIEDAKITLKSISKNSFYKSYEKIKKIIIISI